MRLPFFWTFTQPASRANCPGFRPRSRRFCWKWRDKLVDTANLDVPAREWQASERLLIGCVVRPTTLPTQAVSAGW
jgi:hypothetical protein